MALQLPVPPVYDRTGLVGVLPSAAGALRVPGFDAEGEELRGAVVVLVDGLGAELLRRRSGHAPFLRKLLNRSEPGTVGYPSTTATSMGTFGTGLPPGAHGLAGYQVRDPHTGLLFNELSWEDGPEPEAWQPEPTVFERAARDGVQVTMVANDYFEGSGLTRAALRGADFRTDGRLSARCHIAVQMVRRPGRQLVYLYWGQIDRTGHEHGCDSAEWTTELERVDDELSRLAGELPRGVGLWITADHGMVDVPAHQRVEISTDAELDDGVDLVGGEMRALQLYCRPGAADDVLATWQGRFGDRAWILGVEDAIDQGWFGPVHDRVRPRLGDVHVAFRDAWAVTDARVMHPKVLQLPGQHGSLTPDELLVPVLHTANV